MKLRRWQREALSRILSHFRAGNEHFLCLATPGAGKTFLASTVAQKLLDSADIDLVFCFSPSVNVANAFQCTLESVLGERLDGLLGARGKVLTYQSMLNLKQSFWSLLDSHRALVIFDEIHHCAGDNLNNANTWGQKIIRHIQGKATYTLALTGTPWRSDRIPIALTSYCQKGKVHCDYTYGLTQAIRDQVCRIPKIIAVDNEKILVKTDQREDHYRSFGELLKSSKCSYQQLLENTALIEYLLKYSGRQLDAVRKSSPNAGGLIVAASVEHAIHIANILEARFGEVPAVVTYLHDDSQQIIQQFRNTNSKWIISVGMISEGTDIPRLRVCCHLTRVKTELYFRQVLGRILRIQSNASEEAYLFMPAEPNLVGFAERVSEDVPSANTVSIKLMDEGLEPIVNDDVELSPEELLAPPGFAGDPNTPLIAISEPTAAPSNNLPTSLADVYETTLGLFGRFKKRMIHISSMAG